MTQHAPNTSRAVCVSTTSSKAQRFTQKAKVSSCTGQAGQGRELAPVCWLYRWRMSCVGMTSAGLVDAFIWNRACDAAEQQ